MSLEIDVEKERAVGRLYYSARIDSVYEVKKVINRENGYGAIRTVMIQAVALTRSTPFIMEVDFDEYAGDRLANSKEREFYQEKTKKAEKTA